MRFARGVHGASANRGGDRLRDFFSSTRLAVLSFSDRTPWLPFAVKGFIGTGSFENQLVRKF
jgi:hypothetical protein